MNPSSDDQFQELKAEIQALHAQVADLNAARRKGRRTMARATFGLLVVCLLVFAAALMAAKPQAKSGSDPLSIEGNVVKITTLEVGGKNVGDAIQQLDAMPGAVMSFNRDSCPAGWKEYSPAYGRFIRGIDKSG